VSPQEQLRDLPAVHQVVERLADLAGRYPRELIVSEVRSAVEQARKALQAGGPAPDVEAVVRQGLLALTRPSLQRVINATGVVLHTNLGRAPLGEVKLEGGYTNLEFDLTSGKRGKRDIHAGWLLERLLGKPGIVVNNNAAAVYLALNELASGGEVIVSRGELIEIGDGFRIPDIMQRSGATLREVGATNRTRLEDYRAAVTERTRLIMMVHPSNFRLTGFTGKPGREEIVALGRELRIPVYEDLGSGCLADLRGYGIQEPRPQEALEGGVNLISFSGDKLMGGPQAGILAGDAGQVARLRKNPMFRALRVDKMILGALESVLRDTLLERWDRVPAVKMIALGSTEIRHRAEDIAEGMPAEIVEGQSVIGGGSTPEQSLPTWLVSIKCDAAKVAEKLRAHSPPVVARIEEGRLIVDLRTVAPEEEKDLRHALNEALSEGCAI
jgi:L-seryl-tRNA(Ser) seleniumtransferase